MQIIVAGQTMEQVPIFRQPCALNFYQCNVCAIEENICNL